MTPPSIAMIQAAVAEHYRIPLIEMVSDRRSREVSHPRQEAMYLARLLTPLSLPNIGRHFGDRDHTTVIHACRAVEHRIATQEAVATNVLLLRERLGQ